MILLSLLACLTWSDGQARRGELNCELLDACGELGSVGFDSVDACKESAGAQPYSDDDCPGFDAGAMQSCLDATREAVDTLDCDADLSSTCAVCG